MKRNVWIGTACLLGGLMALTVWGGLRGPAQAAEGATDLSSQTDAGDVVINEVMYDPPASPDQWHEWLELYNTTGSAITVTGWVISDGYAGDVIPAAAIAAHGLLIIAADSLTFTADHPGCTATVVNLGGYIGNGLSNSGDRVELWNGDMLVDALSYGADATHFTLPDVAEGHSLERSPLGADTDSAADWVDQSTPTPGEGIAPDGGPQALIGAVLYDGYQVNDADEAVQLVNIGADPLDLTGYRIDDSASGSSYVSFSGGTLQPGQRIWAAWKGTSFTLSFGHPPDYEAVDTDPAIPDLNGSWPGYSNSGDEVVLRDGADDPVDVLVYEGGLTTTTGWSGPAVQPCPVGRAEGQVFYRIPQEGTGLPIGDTNTAADWVQNSGNVTYGRRALYPGWDMEPLFWPLSATAQATVVVGVAPDAGFDVLSQTIGRAQHAISVAVYSLRHPEVVTALVQQAQAGVSVTVLLEGQQAGVSRSNPRWQQELWACREIEAAGGQCWFMVHDPDGHVFNRYDYLHAKFLVVDDAWVLVTSQNLSDTGLPSDDRSNGTYGSRGVVLATNAAPVTARAAQVFALDLDPTRHADLLRWSQALTGTYGPPFITYTPQLTIPDSTTTTVHFLDPLVVSGTFGFEMLTAPEAALRRSDGLLGLVDRAGAGDEVYVEQLYEHADWGGDPATDPNLRLEAYIGAARRGARVRILLNGGDFGRPGFQNVNTATVAYVNQIARDEGLDLEAATGDPTFYGIHNKMILVRHSGVGHVHIGSINGSESSNKLNREMAIQVSSNEVYDYLKGMFDLDWRWSQPVYLPLVVRRYTPPADHLLISEVSYWGACEWVEVYNPTPLPATLTGCGVGDARKSSDYEGMYRFPTRVLGPGEVVVVAGDAARCAYVAPDYEMFGADPRVPNLSRDQSWGTGEFGLGNQGDEVLLLDHSDQAIDVVVYGSGSYPGVAAHPGVDWGDTLERVPAYADSNDCGQDFGAGWSPGWAR